LQQANKLYVIGIGYRPLGIRAKELVLRADVLLASSRLHDVFQRYAEYDAVKDRIKVINKVPDTISFIRDWFSQSARKPIVLLASGDPLFFGIGRRMITEFGAENIEILPDLSSMQEAFARVKEAWDDAVFISLHGGPDIAKRRTLPYEVKDIPQLLERTGKMGILTDRVNNPVVIAQILQSAYGSPTPLESPLGKGGLRGASSAIIMHVCEHLGYPDEKITSGTPEEIAAGSFADPNVVVVKKTEDRGQKTDIRFGLREEGILHERGLITKDEVRAVTIHKLRLPQTGVLWDIGAGSGSVSLEAARLCPGLRVIAIEKEQERVNTIGENVTRYSTQNVEVISGSAPDALSELPAPDRVFIGGSGGNLADIVKLVHEKMSSGIVVINAATLETLQEALAAFEANGFSTDVSEISVSRSKIVAGKRLMSALNPIFIITGEKK